MEKKILWITGSIVTSNAIGLEIGKDITQEEADELLKIREDDYYDKDDEFDILTHHLDYRTVTDCIEIKDVSIYVKGQN